MAYTLILIPEIKIASETTVVLSYFAQKKGLLVFYAYPEDCVDEGLSIQIADIMNQALKEGFFIHRSSTFPSSLNYYFEIPSEWARGNKEMLKISITVNKLTNQLLEEDIQEICADFVSNLKNTQELFKALYVQEINKFEGKDRSDIKKISECLKTKINEVYKKMLISTKRNLNV